MFAWLTTEPRYFVIKFEQKLQIQQIFNRKQQVMYRQNNETWENMGGG